MFSHILIVFSKTVLFISLKKSFSKLFFAFCFSIAFTWKYGFSQGFWLNSITLWTFFKITLSFNACFKFLMCIKHSILSCKLAKSYSAFITFILPGNFGKSLRSSCNILGYWISSSRKYSSSFSSLRFLWNLH